MDITDTETLSQLPRRRADGEKFRKWFTSDWSRSSVTDLSDGAFKLYAWIHNGPETRLLPGLMNFSVAATAERLRRPMTWVTEHAAELEAKTDVRIDREHGVAFRPGAIADDPPTSPTHVTHYAKVLPDIYDSPLKIAWRDLVVAWCRTHAPKLVPEVMQLPVDGAGYPLGYPLGYPPGYPIGGTETDPDPDPEPEPEQGGSSGMDAVERVLRESGLPFDDPRDLAATIMARVAALDATSRAIDVTTKAIERVEPKYRSGESRSPSGLLLWTIDRLLKSNPTENNASHATGDAAILRDTCESERRAVQEAEARSRELSNRPDPVTMAAAAASALERLKKRGAPDANRTA